MFISLSLLFLFFYFFSFFVYYFSLSLVLIKKKTINLRAKLQQKKIHEINKRNISVNEFYSDCCQFHSSAVYFRATFALIIVLQSLFSAIIYSVLGSVKYANALVTVKVKGKRELMKNNAVNESYNKRNTKCRMKKKSQSVNKNYIIRL